MQEDAVEQIRERRRQLIRERYRGSVEALIDEAIRWEKAHPRRTLDLRNRQLSRETA